MPIYPRYTFFEMATQHGFVASLFKDLVTRWEKFAIVRDRETGEIVYRAFRDGSEVPFFEFRTQGRSTTQSQKMWEDAVREAALAAWALNKGPKDPPQGAPAAPAVEAPAPTFAPVDIIPPTIPVVELPIPPEPATKPAKPTPKSAPKPSKSTAKRLTEQRASA